MEERRIERLAILKHLSDELAHRPRLPDRVINEDELATGAALDVIYAVPGFVNAYIDHSVWPLTKIDTTVMPIFGIAAPQYGRKREAGNASLSFTALQSKACTNLRGVHGG